MSSIRNLKKDVDFLIDEIIYDCFLYLEFNGSEHTDKAQEVLNKAADLRNDLFERINNPNGKDDSKLVKQHFKSIRKDLFTGVDGLFEELSRLPKSSK